MDGSAFYPGYHACAESVAGKGEAFVSGLQPGEDELAGYLALLSWRLHRLVSPRQMAAKELPHEQWSDEIPPILAFYSYCEMEKPAVAAAAPAGASVAAPASVKQQPEPACLQRDGSLIQAAPDADLPGSP